MPQTLFHLVDMPKRHRRPDEEPRRLLDHDGAFLLVWPLAAVFLQEVNISEVDVVEFVIDKLPDVLVGCAQSCGFGDGGKFRMLELGNDFGIWAAGHEEGDWKRGELRQEFGDEVEELSLVPCVEFVKAVDNNDEMLLQLDIAEGVDDELLHLVLKRRFENKWIIDKCPFDAGNEIGDPPRELVGDGSGKVCESVAFGVALPDKERRKGTALFLENLAERAKHGSLASTSDGVGPLEALFRWRVVRPYCQTLQVLFTGPRMTDARIVVLLVASAVVNGRGRHHAAQLLHCRRDRHGRRGESCGSLEA